MSRRVNLNPKLASLLLENNSDVLLTEKLRSAFPDIIDAEGQPLQYWFSTDVLLLFRQVLRKFVYRADLEESEERLLTELFRCYRIYTVEPNVQRFLSSDTDFLREVQSVLKLQQNSALKKVVMQFLCNMMAGNKKSADAIHEVFFEDIMESLRERCCVQESAAALYSLILFKNISLNCEMFAMIINIFEENEDMVYMKLLIEKSLMYEDFWEYFSSFEVKQRVGTLKFLSEMLILGTAPQLPNTAFHSLTDCFTKCQHTVFEISSESDDSKQKAIEAFLLLEVIASLSCLSQYLKVLQMNKSLMIHCGVLLINIHRLGKTKGNCFTPVQHLRQVEEKGQDFSAHPAVGFKGFLIRAIGNLSYKSKIMQDLVSLGLVMQFKLAS